MHALPRFLEKPDAATAQALVTGGAHLWNSGMFVFTAATLLEEMGRYAPDVLTAVSRAVTERTRDLDFHRAEHWVVVSGIALVTRDADEILIRENESIYLPLGCTHRMANPGRIPLTLIEVQSGSYLGEDDIVRLEDTYGRI